MKQKTVVRIACIVLALMLVLSTALIAVSSISASAVSSGQGGYINASDVNLRSGAGTNYSVITCMSKNTKFTFADGKLYNSSWYKIKLNSNSKTGYVHKDYATAVSSSSNSSGSSSSTGYINADYVNLRSGAGTTYSIVTCMSRNTKFTFISTSLKNSSWYNIKLSNGKTGYVHKDYATADSKSNNSQSNNPTNTSASTGYINAAYVNLRSGAGTNYSVVTCMSLNTKFTFISTSLYNSSWYHIKLSNGKSGYVHKDYATADSKPNNSQQTVSTVTGYVNANDVNLRSGAGTNYSIVTCMSKNTKFNFIDTSLHNSNWYHIKLSNGKTGYIYKTYATKNASQNTNNTKPSTPATKPANPSSNNGSVKLSSSKETLYIGNQYVLYATGSSSVSWSSSNSSVATVNSNGVITAKKAGSATIKATAGKSSASCTITVKSGSSVNITTNNVGNMRRTKSLLLKSSTNGVSWKSSNKSIATVDNGLVYANKTGYVTITAYTSRGAASCLINITGSDNIRFTYATPNSAALNSTVKFKAITDTARTAVRFVVSNGSTSYTVEAKDKVKDGNDYIWTASKKLTKSGKWTIKSYACYANSKDYRTTAVGGEAEVYVTTSTDNTTTVCCERRVSDELINLVANYEGFLSKLEPDVITSDPNIGYGRIILGGEQFYNNLTKNEAYAYLVKTLNSGGYTSKTNSFLLNNGIKFNQRQFDALVCFAYNVGASAIANDSDLQSVLLNTGSGTTVKAGSSGYVNDSYVNLRSGAGTNYSILTCMNENTKFTFVDGKIYNSNWYKIKLTNGITGYIYKSYASSSSGGSRDLNNVSKSSFISNFLQYHHAAGSCYWGLLYRRVDEAEMFFYGDYARDGERNKKGFSFSCYKDRSFSIG